MKKPCLVILIGFLPNPRIYKRIDLERKKFDVHLICWDRGSNVLDQAKEGEYSVHTIQIDASSDPLKRIIPYARFSKAVKNLLEQLDPCVIHVQGLDMLKIAVQYSNSKSKNVHLIYEVADLHRLLVDPQRSLVRKVAQFYLKHEDKLLTKKIDLLIITSQMYADRYFSEFVCKEKIFYFPNIPDLRAFETYKKHEPHSPMTIGYIGGVRYKKQIENLIIAAKECELGLMIAGFELEPIEIELKCKAYERGEWIGKFDFMSQAASLYEKCDIMYSVYNADMANVKVALPNKLYEAIYCEMPLIVAKGTYLEQIVNKWGIGVAVDHREPKELIQTLKRFRDDLEYYNNFVENCKRYKSEIDLKVFNDSLMKKIEEFIK